MQPCDWPEPLLHGNEVYHSDFHICHVQYDSCVCFSHGLDLQVNPLLIRSHHAQIGYLAWKWGKFCVHLCRLEKVDIRKVHCQAKVLGTIVTLAGAMIMTLTRGPALNLPWTRTKNQHPSQSATGGNTQDFVMGALALTAACFCLSCFMILQVSLIYQNRRMGTTRYNVKHVNFILLIYKLMTTIFLKIRLTIEVICLYGRHIP